MARTLLFRKTLRFLFWGIIGLLIVNVYGHLFLVAGSASAKLLDVNSEKNFAAAFSAALLLICAMLLRGICTEHYGDGPQRRHRRRFWIHWQGLSLLFLIMAMDEWLMLHERVNMFLSDRFSTHGIFYYAWLIPALLFLLLFLGLYARFIISLPATTRRRFLSAGTLYLAGAVGMEMVSGHYIDTHGLDHLGMLALLNGIEEAAEMFGALTFIRALMLHLLAL